MQVLVDVKPCSSAQVTTQASYLSATSVRSVADRLIGGEARLSTAKIRSRAGLGTTQTIFRNLGTLKPQRDEPRRFLVSEVLPSLKTDISADPKMLREIEALMASDEGMVEYNVTILRSGDELVIVDGNKRSIAFFERRRHAADDWVDYSVFVIDGLALQE